MAAFTSSSATNSLQLVAECAGSNGDKALNPSALSVNTHCQSENAQGDVKPRFVSKLSSRHNRRKRRQREHKDPSAKKSRGGRRQRDCIPIPSFTPIVDDDSDDVDVKVAANTRVPEQASLSSSACPTKKGSDATIKAPAPKNAQPKNQGHGIPRSGLTLKIDEANDVPALSAAPAHTKQTKKEQYKMHREDGSPATAIQPGHTTEDVSTGDFTSCQNGVYAHNTATRKSSSREPTNTASGESTLSTLGAATKTVEKQQPFTLSAKNSLSPPCLPAVTNKNALVARQNGTLREGHAGEGTVEAAKRPSKEDGDGASENNVEIPRDGRPKESVPVLDLSSEHESKSSMLKEVSAPPLPRTDDHKQPLCGDLFEMNMHAPVGTATVDALSSSANDAPVVTHRNTTPSVASLPDDMPVRTTQTSTPSSSAASNAPSTDGAASIPSAQKKQLGASENSFRKRPPDGTSIAAGIALAASSDDDAPRGKSKDNEPNAGKNPRKRKQLITKGRNDAANSGRRTNSGEGKGNKDNCADTNKDSTNHPWDETPNDEAKTLAAATVDVCSSSSNNAPVMTTGNTKPRVASLTDDDVPAKTTQTRTPSSSAVPDSSSLDGDAAITSARNKQLGASENSSRKRPPDDMRTSAGIALAPSSDDDAPLVLSKNKEPNAGKNPRKRKQLVTKGTNDVANSGRQTNSGKRKGNKENCVDTNKDSTNNPWNENPSDEARTPGWDPSKETVSDQEMVTVPIKPFPLSRQADKQNNVSRFDAKTNKRSKYFESATSGSSEVIEIIDNDAGDDIGYRVVPTTKKERRRKNSTTDKKTGAPGKNRKPDKSSRTRKKRKAPASISRTSSDSSSEEEKINDRTSKIKESKRPKQSKKNLGNKLCFACSSCKCNSRAGTDATPRKKSALTGSDACQEQSLVNRLQRIERDIAWKEGQRNNVFRDLRKHRGQVLKKWEGQSTNAKAQRPRFLADADMSEDMIGSHKLRSQEIERAQSRIFGKQKTHQPTLTQILGGSKSKAAGEKPSESDCDDESNVRISCAEGANTLNAHRPGSPDDDGAFLAFWDDSAPVEDSTQCFGSMDYFNRAAAKFKDNGMWAKATANTLQIEEEEGFDALVDLFDVSLEKNRTERCSGCSQNSGDDEDASVDWSLGPLACPLTPKGEEVAKEIKTSVQDDPLRLAAIERMCPNWKENIELAQAQTDSMALHSALMGVKQAKTDIENMKERILKAFMDRYHTLELFEQSLQGSIDKKG